MARILNKSMIGACAAVAFSAVSAAVSDSFEDGTTGSAPSNWSGNGTVAEETYTYSKAESLGLPLEAENITHAKILSVAGQTVRTYASTEATSGDTVKIDMMVKITANDDVPEVPDVTNDIQVAVATGAITEEGSTKAPLYIYEGAESGWVASGKSYETNSWVRLIMLLDYTAKTCGVTVDGDLVKTVAFPGTPTTDKKVSSITAEGVLALDDVVVTAGTSDTPVKPFPDGKKSDTAKVGDGDAQVYVDLNWLYENKLDGASVNMATICSDSSGMTYAQKYEAGLDVADGKKFEVTSMTVADAKTAAFTVPGAADAYEVVMDVDGTTSTVTPSTTTTDGVTTATVSLENVTGKVIKFQLKAKAK